MVAVRVARNVVAQREGNADGKHEAADTLQTHNLDRMVSARGDVDFFKYLGGVKLRNLWNKKA